MIIGVNESQITQVKILLNKKFKVKYLGELKYFLGLNWQDFLKGFFYPKDISLYNY